MRLAVSNIAWSGDLEPRFAELLPTWGVDGVEVAPGKVHPEPLQASPEVLARYRDVWTTRGLRIVALQALLFGKPQFQLFGEAANREAMLAYLCGMVDFARELGAEVLVFGSPKNRQRGPRPPEEAWAIAVDFFRRLGRVAADAGCWFCIEPNPPEYGCDFVTSAVDGLRLVQEVDQPGFGLHLDGAGLSMVGDPLEQVMRDAGSWWRHFHVSEPQLVPVGSGGTDHARLAAGLVAADYQGWVSLEMKTIPDLVCTSEVERAVQFAKGMYQSR